MITRELSSQVQEKSLNYTRKYHAIFTRIKEYLKKLIFEGRQ